MGERERASESEVDGEKKGGWGVRERERAVAGGGDPSSNYFYVS